MRLQDKSVYHRWAADKTPCTGYMPVLDQLYRHAVLSNDGPNRHEAQGLAGCYMSGRCMLG